MTWGDKSLSNRNLGRRSLDSHDWDEGGHGAMDIQKTNQLTGQIGRGNHPESIESFIEVQSFLWSHDSALRPSPLPLLSLASCLSFLVFLCVAGRSYVLTGEGWKGYVRTKIILLRESLANYKSFFFNQQTGMLITLG
jgi:hypothetical protein